MRLKVPLIGTVVAYDPVAAQLDGLGVIGDNNDPVRVDIDLGNVSWRLISIDLENDMAEIEVTPSEEITKLKPGGNPDNAEDWVSVKATASEKSKFLKDAQDAVKDKKGRLTKTEDEVKLWKEKPPKLGLREKGGMIK